MKFLFCMLLLLAYGEARPLPRAASLKTSPLNVRVGPGKQYPIIWILSCPHLPVRIIADFDVWRQIQDPFGTQGWVHQSMLSGRKTAFVQQNQTLYASPSLDARPLARLQKGVILEIQKKKGHWYAVRVQKIKGFVPQSCCWTADPP